MFGCDCESVGLLQTEYRIPNTDEYRPMANDPEPSPCIQARVRRPQGKRAILLRMFISSEVVAEFTPAQDGTVPVLAVGPRGTGLVALCSCGRVLHIMRDSKRIHAWRLPDTVTLIQWDPRVTRASGDPMLVVVS